MCGRIVWVWDTKTHQLVAKLVDHAFAPDAEVMCVLEKMRYNVPPASHLPFISGEKDGNHVRIARWGVPIPARPNGVFNTKIETAFESPMWRGMVGKWHGVLTVRGFYEWRRTPQRNTPFFIHRKDGEPMILAALLGRRTLDGESRLCASIVTCPPNKLVATTHDRMPVILEERNAREWLDASKLSDARILELASPAGHVLVQHEVSANVNTTENDDPSLPEPVGQKRLF